MTQAEYDTIVIDGMPFKAMGGIQTQNLAVFQRKFVIGDYTRDSHPLLSSWVVTDWSGGHGIQQLEEGSDSARYRWGVIDARKPRQVTLPPLATAVTTADAELAAPLGTLAGTMYAVYGAEIYSWNESTGAMVDTLDALTTGPVNRAVEFLGKLYVPLGSSGWDAYDGGTVTHGSSPTVQSFCVMGESLLALATDGQIHQSVDGSTWADLGAGAQTPFGTPRHLVPYVDRSGVPAPYVVTGSDVWALDLAGPSLYRTDLPYPAHRAPGWGAAVWRGDLYTSVGMGVFRYNGDVISALGLDRDQGLPADVRGRVSDLCNEYNALWALVESAGDPAVSADEEWEWDTRDDEMYVSLTSTKASVHQWTGFGWHCVWEATEPSGMPTWMFVGTASNAYRLWWGMGTAMYTMRLPIDFANARGLLEAGDGEFAAEGYVYSGQFDAGMPNYLKIANAVRLRTRFTSATEKIRVSYVCTCSATPEEVLLGEVTEPGDTVFFFGDADAETGVGVGSPFREMEIRLELERGADSTKAPMVETLALTFLKVLPSSLSWTAQLDLTAPFMGNSSQTMADKLEAVLVSSRFVTLVHRGTAYRVRLAMTSGSDSAGWGDERSMRTVNILEMRADL